MNFGILMIQGLVNSFGPAVMAAFAAVVKVDSFAYMPAQEFGNAYSLFVSQNFGAGKQERIQQGTKRALQLSAAFCVVISVLVFAGAKLLMLIFISPAETEIIAVGVQYLRIEGAFYIGIGILFLLYGYYRRNQPANNVAHSHSYLSRNQSSACISPLCSSFYRRAGHLGIHSYWLDSC